MSFSCSNNGPVRIKDTARNVKNGNGFTVNIISEPFIENANVASIDAPPGFDEWTITGLTKAPSVLFVSIALVQNAWLITASS